MRAVIFDLDGTLTQSDEGIFKSIRYAARKLGFAEPPESDRFKFIGPPLMYSFREYLGMTREQAVEAQEAYRERYWDTGLFENRVYPGIRSLLRMLKKRGDWVAIATGKPSDPARRIAEHFGLNRYFDRIIGPDLNDGNAAKDALILAALPERFDEAVMVGDRHFDIEGANALGLPSVGAGWGYGTEEELRSTGCTHYAARVGDLIDLLCPGDPMPRGAFLSVEGLDGSGKSTQIGMLSEALDRWGFVVRHSREPGGSPVGERIREILLTRGNEMESLTEALLFAASRAEHVRKVIRPAVERGEVLLCDRFVDSSAAYQGGGRELGVDRVMQLNAPAVDGTLPLATLYLDIGHEQAMRRRTAASDPDRMESEPDSFHARVEAAYRTLIGQDPRRFVVVDASRSPEEVGRDAAAGILARLTAAEEADE